MKKTLLFGISALLLTGGALSSFLYSTDTVNSGTPEVAALINYKDTIISGGSDKINILATIVTKNLNANEDLIANKSDVVLEPDVSPIEGLSLLNYSQNNYDPAFQVNENAPKKPTIFTPFETLGETKNIQEGTPLFFISYFQDGNNTQEGGYTSYTFRSSTGAIVNKMYLGQAKQGAITQIPAKNKTYTYGFYQTQNLSNLFIEGGNLNMTSSGITGVNTSSILPIGQYQVIIENINKFGFKSKPVTAGTLNIIPTSVGGTITEACGGKGISGVISCVPYASYVSDPANFTFRNTTDVNGVRLTVNKGGATTAEYVNSSVVDTNAGISSGGASWTFNNIKLLEGQNFITINFRDSGGSIINSVPIVITYDSTPPKILGARLNIEDYYNSNPVNLYNDGSFEWGNGTYSSAGQGFLGQNTPWRAYLNKASGGVASFNKLTKYHGDQSLRLDLTQTGSYFEVMNEPTVGYAVKTVSSIPVKPNTTYQLSGWVKVVRNSGTSSPNGGAVLYARATNSVNANPVQAATAYIHNTQDWTYLTTNFTTLADADVAHIQMRFYGHIGLGTYLGAAFFDDVKLEEVNRPINTTFDNQANMRLVSGIYNINDNLSMDKMENLTSYVPFVLEFEDNNIGFNTGALQIFWSKDLNSNFTQIVGDTNAYIKSITKLGNRITMKVMINELGTPSLKSGYNKIGFRVTDSSGNTSEVLPVEFELNRTVNQPVFINNNGESFATKDERVDIRLKIERDVKTLTFNGETYNTLGNTEITMYGRPLSLGENTFTAEVEDIMGNKSTVGVLKIIRTSKVPEGLNGTDTQLKINGSVSSSEIDFNRITPDGSAGEIIQGTSY